MQPCKMKIELNATKININNSVRRNDSLSYFGVDINTIQLEISEIYFYNYTANELMVYILYRLIFLRFKSAQPNKIILCTYFNGSLACIGQESKLQIKLLTPNIVKHFEKHKC